jgi:hypothetical protein
MRCGDIGISKKTTAIRADYPPTMVGEPPAIKHGQNRKAAESFICMITTSLTANIPLAVFICRAAGGGSKKGE